jgi:hypothetical protein
MLGFYDFVFIHEKRTCRSANVWCAIVLTLMWLELIVDVSIAVLQIHAFHEIQLFLVFPAKE